MADFASSWQAASKVVSSTTLTTVSTAGTRPASRFDPVGEHELKVTVSSELMIGGADLGLLDERRLRNGVMYLRYRALEQ